MHPSKMERRVLLVLTVALLGGLAAAEQPPPPTAAVPVAPPPRQDGTAAGAEAPAETASTDHTAETGGEAASRSPPGRRNLLLDGSFDRGAFGGFSGWRVETVGRSKVGGPARLSTVAPLPRAGRGGSGGARFVQPVGARLLKGLVALPIPAVEGRRYRLRVWLKLDRLERRPKGQPPGLSAAVRFIDEKGEAVPYRGRPWLFGKPVRAAEWTERSLEFVVPRGAFAFEPAVLFTWYGEASVDDAEVVPAEPPDWEEVPGQGLDLHHLPGDGLDAKTREELTDTARRLSKRLGVPLPHPLHYYKYPDRKTLRYLLGVKGDVHIVLPDEVHSILPVDAFGIARLLADRGWAPDLKTPPLLSRGLAVALAGRWLGEPPEKLARRLAGQRRLPSIETMGLSSGTFYRVHPAAAYAVAGAFVGWLIDHFGIDRFKTLYTSFGTQEPGPLFAERVEAVYGVPLKALEVQWRASLAL